MANSKKYTEAYNGFSDKPHITKINGYWLVWSSGGRVDLFRVADSFAGRLNEKRWRSNLFKPA